MANLQQRTEMNTLNPSDTFPQSIYPSSRMVWLSLLAILAILQGGCIQLAEVDSSRSPVYAPMIGRTFELREDFYAHGMKLPDQTTAGIEYVMIMPPPRISGHLVVDLGRVPAGSRFRIVGVVTRKSTLFPATEYTVSFDDPQVLQGNGKPVRICATTPAWKLYVKPASSADAPQLNEQYFKPVDQAKK